MNNCGFVVAILGVDGAGKSTVIDSIKPALYTMTRGEIYIKHLRPGLLPPLARLKGKNAVPIGPVLDPHGSTPSGIFGSFARLIYLLADYVVGYWLLIRPKIANQPAIVLYDRYAYDMALDPRRFRIGLPGGLVYWFAKLAPKPDIIICLHALPKVIVKRKKELPIREIQRQVNELKKFAKNEPNAILISTVAKKKEVRDKILTILMNHFRNKNKRCDFLEKR